MKVTSTKQIEKFSSQKSSFHKFDQGENRFRIVSDIHAISEHRLDLNGKFKSPICPIAYEAMLAGDEDRQPDPSIKCPICEKFGRNNYPKVKFICIAINRKDKSIGILKGGHTIFDTVLSYNEDPEYGDVKKFDIKINRKGDKLETKYTVSASPKQSNLTEEEMSEVISAGIDLEKMTTPRSYDELKEVMNGEDPYDKPNIEEAPF